jgi:hypothetical protein
MKMIFPEKTMEITEKIKNYFNGLRLNSILFNDIDMFYNKQKNNKNINKNINIDMLLDKINKTGLNSLTNKEKDFLKNHKF